MRDPKTTDQRQARTIADAIIERLEWFGNQGELDGFELAHEGRLLVQVERVDWEALLSWNRRACEWMLERAPTVRPYRV